MHADWTEGNWPIYMLAFGVHWVPFEESEQCDEEWEVDWIIWRQEVDVVRKRGR